MIVTFNNRPVTLPDHATLAQLLEKEGLLQKGGMAVAVEGRIVRKPEWASRELQSGDQIMAVFAAYGG